MSRRPLFILPLILYGQTPDTATIHGQVVDQSRSAIEGVKVTAKNAQTGLERAAETTASGHFTLGGLPIAGQYTIVARKQGFAEARLDSITLAGGTSAEITLQLNVAGGETEIIVTGVVGGVRTDAPQLGDRLSAFQMQETPLLNRKVSYLPLLNAANRPPSARAMCS
jgi:hypothetical protein